MFDDIILNLKKKGYIAEAFSSREKLLERIEGIIDKTEQVGFGGSETVNELLIPHALESKGYNVMSTRTSGLDYLEVANKNKNCNVYMCSVNAMTKDGILINLDGRGNRIGMTCYGADKMIYVIGENKITENLEEGIKRVKEIAAPLNAKRLNKDTPCAFSGVCSDCDSPERICRGWLINERAFSGKDTYVFIINEKLGL